MGRLQAEEIASMLKQEQALEWHLQCNHYPPVNKVFIPIAQEAIELANQGIHDQIIKMPNGIKLSVEAIIEGLHLDTFLDQSTYDGLNEDVYEELES